MYFVVIVIVTIFTEQFFPLNFFEISSCEHCWLDKVSTNIFGTNHDLMKFNGLNGHTRCEYRCDLVLLRIYGHFGIVRTILNTAGIFINGGIILNICVRRWRCRTRSRLQGLSKQIAATRHIKIGEFFLFKFHVGESKSDGGNRNMSGNTEWSRQNSY